MNHKKFLAIVLIGISAAYFLGAKPFEFKAIRLGLEQGAPEHLSTTVSKDGNKCKIKTTLVGTPPIYVDIDQIRTELKRKKGDDKWLTITGKTKKGVSRTVGVSLNRLRPCLIN